MSLNDPLASALSKIQNAERAGKNEVQLTPVSRQIQKVLDILNDSQYVGAYQENQSTRGTHMTLNLVHCINKIGAIKPRFSFRKADYENVEKQYLPAKDFGVIIVTTPQGIMTLEQAKERGIGGKLLAYCY